MPFRLGTPELVILLVIVLLLFGVGRIGRIATELGRGIRDFRRGLSEEDEKSADKGKSDDEMSQKV
jgi:sec-independent protein translocase protein TatA